MRLILLLLPALLLTIGCAGRPAIQSNAQRFANSHAKARHSAHRHRKSKSQRAASGVLGAIVDIAAYESLQARERRRLVAMIRALPAPTPPPVAPQSMAPRVVAIARPTPNRPATIADRMGQRVRLTLTDNRVVVGVLLGHTGIYAFVRDDAGQMQQVVATDIVEHGDAESLTSTP